MESLEQVIARKQVWKQKLRNQEAKALRDVRNSLRKEVDPDPFDWDEFFSNFMMMVFLIIVATIIIAVFSPKAHAWSDGEIVRAIYIAEGGNRAKFPYGIRSVKCSGEAECRKVCLNTIRRNRIRYKDYGRKTNSDFISFLGSKFCPTKGKNLSRSEQRLNRHWVSNVKSILNKGVA